ncbi:hypothetical protein F4813DRAFT_266996 [Daldinia decipiens]|uniref:uncharacterized protein n=1 Tax=Daldinia decipiens TaxID=326647 RepID=UPI0020C38ADA|nr:uncharacterized protein F4813DRAFT_266996 [Daldinia decipiens]KAI1660887.1 hypothetical protein F4813DRAFT_266996 [Daldinia decipiens]
MPKKQSKKQGASSATGDSRFANFESDPRFRLPSKSRTKTTIDKRFSRMLKDDDFVASAKVDKYGRKLKSDNKKKALQNIYQADDDEGAEVDEDHVVERELQKANTKYDPARGGGFSSSESGSDDEDDEDDEDDKGEEDEEAEVATSGSMQRLRDAQADVETGEVTKRIAIVNLDWDYIKSADLLALFSSFVPKGGRIERVSIYPSEFGKERMQREELEGPPREIFKKASESQGEESEPDSEDSDDDEEDDEKIKNDILQEGDDQDFDSDALRAYQLDRLRYYYAVMVCSDTATAEKIYAATDGTEYQSSSNFMDLRFIPDDVTFDDEPRDECDSISPDYKPTEFTTDALQHSKVKLTWDIHPEETTRREDIKRAFSGSRAEIEENDLRAYLASDNSDDEDARSEGEEDQAEVADDQPKLTKRELKAKKLREALGLSSEPLSRPSKSGPVGDMQVTFSAALMDDGKKKKEPDAEETTIEKYMRKERERKARRKEKVVTKRDEGSNQTDDETEQPQNDLGFDDPFFTTDEPVKKSKHTEKKEERRKRREAKEAEAAENAAQKAQLERLMAEDSKDAAEHLDHFDMNEISRVEKQKSKKHKKRKKEVEDHGGLQEGFEMDVEDDRFKAVFDSHEFAIDPSNPRYKATPGMKQLLEERRKKRKTDNDATDGQQQQNSKAKKQRR